MTSGNAPKKNAAKTNANGTRTAKRASKSTAVARTPNRRGGRKPKYDWDLIQQTFVEGVPTNPAEPDGEREWLNLRELSERMNVPYDRVREHSSKYRWSDLRLTYQAQIAQQRQRLRAKRIAKDASDFDDRSHTVGKVGMQLVGVRLSEIAQEVKDREQIRKDALRRRASGQAVDKEDLYSAVYARELSELAKAAQVFQEIGQRALGTAVERHEISGPEGGPILSASISVTQELERDDPDRLAAFLSVAQRTGVWAQLAEVTEDVDDDDDEWEPTDEELADQQRSINGNTEDGDIVEAEWTEG